MDATERYDALDARDEIVYMTMKDALELSVALADRVKAASPVPDIVVGLANGALLPTRVLSERLNVPFEIIRVRRKSSRLKQRLLVLNKLLRLPPSVLRWKPLNELNKAFNRGNNSIEQVKYTFDVASKTILIVDDCMDSGRSVKLVRAELLQQGAAEVKIAVIGWGKIAGAMLPDQIPPDFHMHRLLHFYPWSNNSPYYSEFTDWLAGKGMALWR